MPRNIQTVIIAIFASCFCLSNVSKMAFYENKSVPKIEVVQKKMKLFKDSAYSANRKVNMQVLLDSAKKCDSEIEQLTKTSKNRFLDKFWVRAIFMLFFSYWATIAIIREWKPILELINLAAVQVKKLENWQKIAIVFLLGLFFVFFE